MLKTFSGLSFRAQRGISLCSLEIRHRHSTQGLTGTAAAESQKRRHCATLRICEEFFRKLVFYGEGRRKCRQAGYRISVFKLRLKTRYRPMAPTISAIDSTESCTRWVRKYFSALGP